MKVWRALGSIWIFLETIIQNKWSSRQERRKLKGIVKCSLILNGSTLVNKIEHKIANLRLCNKGPKHLKDETDVKDNMQELRFNQYGQYIQEKLGLYKKPKAVEIMIQNFENEFQPTLIPDIGADIESNPILKEIPSRNRDWWLTDSPTAKRINHLSYLKPLKIMNTQDVNNRLHHTVYEGMLPINLSKQRQRNSRANLNFNEDSETSQINSKNFVIKNYLS